MTASNNTLWKTKVAARLHDPAEKALVLLRDPAGHENGTSQALQRLLGLQKSGDTTIPTDDTPLAQPLLKDGIPAKTYQHIQHADWWASAADRPQWPMEEITVDTKSGKRTFRVAPWAQVNWSGQPVLIHPLSGETFDLGKHGGLKDTDFRDIKKRSLEHHKNLLHVLEEDSSKLEDWRKILLALWRFGPDIQEEKDFGHLGQLWQLLPADTRIPDHSIWDHLDLTSAFSGAFAADSNNEAALLTLSIGPVQPFIASSRKLEDLWAGSHLLARLAWEAMRPVCKQFGPDAILFPRLRGVPQVDLWLRDECGLPESLFQNCDWAYGSTDNNPLFSAALPNRFVAIVPASEAQNLATQIQDSVRKWLQDVGTTVITRLLKEAGLDDHADLYCYKQLSRQLGNFPEVHWAIVPFSLIGIRNAQRQTGLDTVELSAAMAPFFDLQEDKNPGFLASPAWNLLKDELALVDDQGKRSVFFAPNPGVLYPAIYDLAERALSAAKAIRPFQQHAETGWRCTLTGETEWLTPDQNHLDIPPGHRLSAANPNFDVNIHCDTLWTRIARQKPAWAKTGEHLGALAAIKRLWPTLFAEEVAKATGVESVGRFVVSTLTMSMAHHLDKWLESGALTPAGLAPLLEQYRHQLQPVALPRRLIRRHAANREALRDAAQLPALMGLVMDGSIEDDTEARKIRDIISRMLANDSDSNKITLETYYGLIMLDGDRMGAWLSGSPDPESGTNAISYLESFHPKVRTGFLKHADKHEVVQQYGKQPRALSPNRHLAISAALNDFSLTVVRHIVEQEYSGRLIYAGGDDVLAMLPVIDTLRAASRLRNAYSGHDARQEDRGFKPGELSLNRGFAHLNGRLMRMMGTHATASCGIVIAHHQAPLPAVRRELAAAEVRAKTKGGRNAFSITIVKRSGGALYLTDNWGEPLDLLLQLHEFLQSPHVSRRAAYHTLQWLNDHELPRSDTNAQLLRTLLDYQLNRQSQPKDPRASGLAEKLAKLALKKSLDKRIDWLRNFISVAEFLAREVRQDPSGNML